MLAVAVLTAALLATGRPQAWLVEWAAQRDLGTRVEVEGVSLIRAFHADAVRIYDVDAEEPTFTLHGVDVERRLFADNGRFIPELRIARVQAHVIAKAPDDSNIAFLRARLDRPRDEPASLTYVPQRIVLADITLDAELSEMGVRLENLSLDAAIDDNGGFDLAVAGDGISGTRWFGMRQTAQPIAQGTLDLGMRGGADGGLRVTLDAVIPELLTITARVANERHDHATHWDIAIDSAEANNLALAGLEEFLLPFPLQFATFEVTDTRVRLVQGDTLSVPEATIDVAAEALYIGPPERLWYGGDISVKGAVVWTDARSADVVVHFSHGQAATISAAGSVQSGTADIVIASWGQEELLDVIPPHYRAQAEALPDVTDLSGTLGATWDGAQYTVQLECTSAAGADGGALALQVQGAGTREGAGDLFAGTVQLAIGRGTLGGSVTLTSATALEADLALEQADLNRWLHVLLGHAAPTLPDATVRGSLALAAADISQGIHVTPTLELTNLTLAERPLTDAAPLAVAGAIHWRRDESVLTAPQLTISVPDRVEITLASWRHDFNSRTGKAETTARIELDWLNVGQLWGDLELAGPISYTRDSAQGPVTFSSGNLGWGDWAVPYGKTLDGSGQALVNYQTRRMTLPEAQAALDENNVLRVTQGTVLLSPFAVELPLRVETNLEPVVAMGLLDAASGSGTFEGHLKQADDVFSLEGAARVTADAVTLPSKYAILRGLELTTDLRYDGDVHGTGTASAASVTAANATLHDVSSPLRWQEKSLLLTEITGRLYEGQAAGNLTLGMLEEGRPIDAELRFSGLDLAAFSEALAPEDVRMTGAAHGDATVSMQEGQLASLRLQAESARGFTISRAMVQKILQLPRFAESVGQRAMDRILGTSPQRPFDRAAVTLALAGTNTLQGQAILESERTADYRGLDLTVDLNLPLAGLAELLALAAQN
jgi:hypothetical protein